MTFSTTPRPAPSGAIPLLCASHRRLESNAGTLESTAEGAASFASELASVIEKYLAQSENGSRIEIWFKNESGGAARQFVVAVKEPDPEAEFRAPAAATAAAEQPVLDPSQFLMYSGTVQYRPKAAEEAVPEKPKNVYDAYWAMQPPEVQVLRTIESEAERVRKAQELARQGFAVDVPIMVWQWDPLMTMRAREAAGYSWVPGANGQPIELGPGIAFPGLRPYDPNNPPPGSIRVSTEWAKGLEETSIWWRPEIFLEPEPPPGSGDEPTA